MKNTICNTTPLLKIGFQAIKWHEQSDRRRRPDISEELQKVKSGDAAEMARCGWMGGMEIMDGIGHIAQVREGFLCAICVQPSFPVDEVLHPMAFPLGIHNVVNFIFLFAILCNVEGAWHHTWLAVETFLIRLNT